MKSMVYKTMVKSGEVFVTDYPDTGSYYVGPHRPRNIMTPVTDGQPLRAAV